MSVREEEGGEEGNIVALNMHNNFVLDFEFELSSFCLPAAVECYKSRGVVRRRTELSGVAVVSLLSSVCCLLAVVMPKETQAETETEAFMRLSIYIVVILIYFSCCLLLQLDSKQRDCSWHVACLE